MFFWIRKCWFCPIFHEVFSVFVFDVQFVPCTVNVEDLGPDSIKICHLTSIGNPIVEIRRS